MCETGGLAADLLVVAYSTVEWWSQERSNLLLPGFDRPLHRQSFRTEVPEVRIELTASWLRIKRPYLQDLAGVRVVGGTRTRILSVAC